MNGPSFPTWLTSCSPTRPFIARCRSSFRMRRFGRRRRCCQRVQHPRSVTSGLRRTTCSPRRQQRRMVESTLSAGGDYARMPVCTPSSDGVPQTAGLCARVNNEVSVSSCRTRRWRANSMALLGASSTARSRAALAPGRDVPEGERPLCPLRDGYPALPHRLREMSGAAEVRIVTVLAHKRLAQLSRSVWPISPGGPATSSALRHQGRKRDRMDFKRVDPASVSGGAAVCNRYANPRPSITPKPRVCSGSHRLAAIMEDLAHRQRNLFRRA